MEANTLLSTLTKDPNSWRRRKKSEKKLRQIFGKSIALDQTLENVEKYGLPVILSSRIPLCYFLAFLIETHRCENLFFYLESESFEEYDFKTVRELKAAGQELFASFVAENSVFEVNITQAIRSKCLEALNAGCQTCFSEAKAHILQLLEPIYIDFRTSEYYEKMRAEVEPSVNIYSHATRDKGIKVLMKQLDKTVEFEQSALASDDSSALQQSRQIILTRLLVKNFCSVRLHVSFSDFRDGRNLEIPKSMDLFKAPQSFL